MDGLNDQIHIDILVSNFPKEFRGDTGAMEYPAGKMWVHGQKWDALSGLVHSVVMMLI
jgi:hypothetical protein